MFSQSTDNQKSFVLRYWRAAKEDPWRFTLENVSSHMQNHFADMDELVDYLKQEANSDTDGEADDDSVEFDRKAWLREHGMEDME